MFGHSADEAVGLLVEDLIPERLKAQHRAGLARYFRTGQGRLMGGQILELPALRKDGTELTVELSLSPIGDIDRRLVVAMVRDVSQRKALEEQLREAYVLQATGLLAAGIAAQFNNQLHAVLGFNELLRENLATDDPLRAYTREVEQAATRAFSLTQELLAFGGAGGNEPRPLDLNDVITNMQTRLRLLLGEGIEVVTELDPELGSVMADPQQVEHILLNIAMNARDAMPEGGTLTVRTRDLTRDSEYVGQHPGVIEAAYVKLAVTDTGHGMDQRTLSRIFDPFFSTRDVGQGMGLGLSAVYGLVRAMGGSVDALSAPGEGTTVRVYLARIPDS